MATFRLQNLESLNGSKTQDKNDAIDVEPYATLVFHVRKPVLAGATSTLSIQHSATLDDSGFHNSSLSFSLDTGNNDSGVLSNPLKYVRWSANVASGNPEFQIDVVARKS